MVLIFVLLIFTVAHFLMSEVLTGQESELAVLERRLAELTESLGMEQRKTEELAGRNTLLSDMVGNLVEAREELSGRIDALTRQTEADAEKIKEQMMLMAGLQEDIDALRTVKAELESRIGQLAAELGSSRAEAGDLRERSKALEARLADEGERTLLAQKEIERKEIRIQALSALVGEQEHAMKEERRLSADARAEVALLNRQINSLRAQLEDVSRALGVAEAGKLVRESDLKELGRRLNIALAREVNKLQQYRSEFFGRLREVLGDSPHVRVEGDRFVLQAELLFDSGSADLGENGKGHLKRLAGSIHEILGKIPKELDWVLRIDGHTDRVPIHNPRYASNWELSTARSVSVVQFLAREGIPHARMAATGFGEFHPLDRADNPEAYRKNRRIEIKLTSR
jgi:chemotaxis protein MotB